MLLIVYQIILLFGFDEVFPVSAELCLAMLLLLLFNRGNSVSPLLDGRVMLSLVN